MWWNAARNATTPVAVIFFHIGKCGGGSIMQWLRKSPGFTLRLDYTRSRLFIALHQDLFTDIHAPWELNGGKTRVGRRPHWRSTSVAVEYHAGAQRIFWQHVHGVLPRLRERYASAGGRLVMLTTVRDPASMIVSWYRQWPPRLPNRSISAFEPWLANASGLLTRALAFVRGSARIWHTTRVPFFDCSADAVALARTRLLQTFDVVGDVSDVGWTLRKLVGCLEWPQAWLPPTPPHVRYLGGSREFTYRETADLARIRSHLERAASCDSTVYEAVRGGWCRCAKPFVKRRVITM